LVLNNPPRHERDSDDQVWAALTLATSAKE
jgi:hypothetical protein